MFDRTMHPNHLASGKRIRDRFMASDAQLLLVEDDPFQRQVVEDYLTQQGFVVQAVGDGKAFRAAMAAYPPSLAMLDVNLPGEDGLSLARWLRAVCPAVGIIMLTAAGDTVDRVVGLECGADDYVTKPFEPRELLARVRALMRRVAPHPDVPSRAATLTSAAATAPRVSVGVAVLDLERRMLLGSDEQEQSLGAAEFELLRLFVENPNRPLHRDWLLERTTPEDEDVLERAIDIRVMRLRRKVERDPSKPRAIRTVRGVGYMFVPGPV